MKHEDPFLVSLWSLRRHAQVPDRLVDLGSVHTLHVKGLDLVEESASMQAEVGYFRL